MRYNKRGRESIIIMHSPGGDTHCKHMCCLTPRTSEISFVLRNNL